MEHNFNKKKSRLFCQLITVLTVLSMLFSLFIPAIAENTGNPVWNGTASEEPTNGAGTAEEPFLIETAANLHYVVKKATTGYYKITNDIYLNNVSNENWVSSNPNSWLKWSKFKGTLDGDGHTIYGLYCDYGDYNVAGLFPRLESGASIKNIKISKANLKNTNPSGYAGAICGQVIGYAEFKNCAVDDTVSVTAPSAGGIVAGLNGNTAGTKFTACYSRATLSGTKAAAGILANAWGGVTVTIENSYCINKFFLYKNSAITAVINNSYSPFGKTAALNPGGISGTYAKVSAEKMIGADAKTNMPNLDWDRTYKTTVTYPDLTFASVNIDRTNYWDGVVSDSYSEGQGTEEVPYLIKNASDLALLVKTSIENGAATKDKYYKITENITVNKIIDSDATQWYTKAGGLSGGFAGHLDGDGHTISGLYTFTTADNSYAGLFPMIESGSTVKNLGIINSSFSAKYVGGICGGIIKNNDQSVIIDTCYLDDTVIISASHTAGGIVGRTAAAVSFSNSYTTSTVQADSKSGGIIGDKWDTATALIIKGCYTTCNKLYGQVQGLSNDSANNYLCDASNIEQYKGISAISKMPGLDWKNVYCLTTEFPALKIFSPDNEISYFEGGSGTKEDPYQISTGEQLMALANEIIQPSNSTLGKYYILTADIQLNDTVDPNWKENNPKEWPTQVGFAGRFKGFFEGNGHTISGLYAVSDNPSGRAGLFTCADSGAVIRNVHISNSYISSKGYVGGILGYANDNGTGEEIKIEACSVDETVVIVGGHAGGIVGGTNGNTSLKYCYSTASISTTTNGHISALLGNSWTGNNKLIQCYFVGTQGYRTGFAPDTLDYVYGTVAVKNGDGIVILQPAQMKGASAQQYMPDLDWENIWLVNENGYPTLRVVPYVEEVPYDGEVGAVWTGKVATNFAGGTGTKDDPYLISTGEQLAKLVKLGMQVKNDTQGKYYVITDDIILNDVTKTDWTDTANEWYTQNGRNDYFKGTLDGQGHTIKGIYHKATPLESITSTYAGLIPVIGAGAIVRNIRIENSDIASKGYAGAVVGYAQSGTDNRQSYVIGCTVASPVTVKGWTAGGIVGGSPDNLSVAACGFSGKLSAPSKGYCSGIIGNIWTANHTIYNCYSVGYHTYRKNVNKPNTIQNVYGTVNQTGVITISSDKMLGENAKKYMPKLDWSIWKTVSNGYPVIGNLPDDYIGLTKYEGVPGQVWSGRLATSFAGGSGTINDPYLISTPEQFALLINQSISEAGATKGKYYKLTHDIKLNDTSNPNWRTGLPNDWYYVTDTSKAFQGHFDGNGHVVFGLYLNENISSTSFTGLFPVVAYGSVIEKVGISQAFLSLKSADKAYRGYVGGIAGYLQSTPKSEADGTNYAKISQCFGDTTVELNGAYAGGMLGGCPSPILIDNCYFIGALDASLEYTGGMIGNIWVEGAIITNSFSHTRDLDPIASNKGSYITMVNTYCTGKNYGDGKKTSHFKIYSYEAQKTLAGFDFGKIWKTVKNGTPVLRVFGSDAYSNTSTPAKIKISFSTNCEQEIAPMSGNAGTKLTLPIPEEREGYAFDGWYVYKELDVKYTWDIYPSFDITLYAKWISLSIEQNFESYPNTEWDRTDGIEYYKPGVVGYSPKNVHDGSKSLHLLSDNSGDETFLVFDDEKLEVGKQYRITYWVLSDSDNSKGDLMLIHSNHPDIWDEKIGYEKIGSLNELQSGEWTEISYTFTANGEYIMFEVVDGSSIYFDSIKVTLLNENGEIGKLQQMSNNVDSLKPGESKHNMILIICAISFGLLVVAVGTVYGVIRFKKRTK